VKVGEIVAAARTRLFLVDAERRELFTLAVADGAGVRETRVPIGHGLAGRAAERNAAANTAEPGVEPEAEPGFRRGLAIPFTDSAGQVFAVLELGREDAGGDFDGDDARRVEALARSLAGALEAWFRMSCSCRKGRAIGTDAPCCAPAAPAAAGRAPP
jgi:hypothetical protein